MRNKKKRTEKIQAFPEVRLLLQRCLRYYELPCILREIISHFQYWSCQRCGIGVRGCPGCYRSLSLFPTPSLINYRKTKRELRMYRVWFTSTSFTTLASCSVRSIFFLVSSMFHGIFYTASYERSVFVWIFFFQADRLTLSRIKHSIFVFVVFFMLFRNLSKVFLLIGFYWISSTIINERMLVNCSN